MFEEIKIANPSSQRLGINRSEKMNKRSLEDQPGLRSPVIRALLELRESLVEDMAFSLNCETEALNE